MPCVTDLCLVMFLLKALSFVVTCVELFSCLTFTFGLYSTFLFSSTQCDFNVYVLDLLCLKRTPARLTNIPRQANGDTIE